MPEEPRERSYTFLGMTTIIASEAMHQLLELVERIAHSNATALITGESGDSPSASEVWYCAARALMRVVHLQGTPTAIRNLYESTIDSRVRRSPHATLWH